MQLKRHFGSAGRATARVGHGRRRLTGRDPHEAQRTSTPLELLRPRRSPSSSG